MRLIDADKLFNRILVMLEDPEIEIRAVGKFMDLVNTAPTVDPPPNDLLTLEELLEIDRELVWISGEGIGRYDICCGISSDNVVQFYKAALPIYNYGRTWLAYRRKPEEVQT